MRAGAMPVRVLIPSDLRLPVRMSAHAGSAADKQPWSIQHYHETWGEFPAKIAMRNVGS